MPDFSMPRVHYATQLFRPNQEARYHELLHCISANSRFPEVARTTVFTDHCELPIINDRIHCLPIDRRATYSDFLALGNESAQDYDYFVFCNTDILLTTSFFELLPHITLPTTLTCITRREVNGELPPNMDPAYTQDAWVLRSQPFNQQLLERLSSICLGIAGCESIFASLMYAYGYNLWNPSLDCVIVHNDTDPVLYPPGCPDGSFRYYGIYAFIQPCLIREVEVKSSNPSLVLCRTPGEYVSLKT